VSNVHAQTATFVNVPVRGLVGKNYRVVSNNAIVQVQYTYTGTSRRI